ncbi:hypothetical protein ACHAWF_016928 [Thalassiosira exigua]
MCKKNISEVNTIETLVAEKWYNNVNIEGKYKSNLCRLAQLYLDGGVYLDNDLELTSSLGGILDQNADVVISLNPRGNLIFQAILGSTKGHHLIKRSWEVFRDHLEGKKTIENPLGPNALFVSLREVYNITGKIDRIASYSLRR